MTNQCSSAHDVAGATTTQALQRLWPGATDEFRAVRLAGIPDATRLS